MSWRGGRPQLVYGRAAGADTGGAMPDVFISYSRRDRPFVARLAQELVDRGRQVWVDTDDIPPTAEWMDEIQAAIAGSDAVLFVLSPAFLASPVCGQELDAAVALNKRLIPVLREAVPAADVPAEVAKRNWIDATSDERFGAAVDDVVTAMDTDLDWVRLHTRLLVRAREWEESGRDRSYLLRGSELSEGELWLASQPAATLQQPTPVQIAYLRASREGARRRQRRLSAALGVGLVVTSVLAVAAWTQRNTAVEQRRVARSRELSASAVGQLEIDPELGILLAREALALAPEDPAAEQALRQSLRDSHVRAEGTHDGPAVWIEAHARGEWAVTASADGTARVWRTEDGQEVATLEHGAPVVRARFAAESARVITAGDDATAKVWDAATGEPIATLEAGGGALVDAALSPDGAAAVTASGDGRAQLWDVAAGTSRPLAHPGGNLRAVGFSPDGRRLVTAGGGGGRTGSVIVWDQRGRRVAGPLRHRAVVEDAAFSPDGRRLATATRDSEAAVWELPSGRRVSRLRGHTGVVIDVEFDSFGEWVLTAGYDGTARLWQADDGTELRDFRGHTGFVVSARFSQDDRFVLTGSDDGTARIFDIDGESTIAVLRGHSDVVQARFVPGTRPVGDRVVTAAADGRFRLWDGAMGDLVAEYDGHATPRLDAVLSVEFSADGRKVVSAGTDGTAAVWDPETGERIGPPLEHERDVETARFDAAGERVVTASRDGTAATWNADGTKAAGFAAHDARVQTAAFDATGRQAVSAGNDGYARIWDPATGDEVQALGPLPGRGWNAEFSPDGRFVATGSDDGTALVWDAATGARTAQLGGQRGSIFGLAFTSAGDALATWGYEAPPGDDVRGRLVVWDPASGEQLADLVQPLPVEDAAFRDDGEVLATGSYSTRAVLWDWRDEQALLTLRGHDDAVTAVDFSPGAGRWLATASYDGTARVWDAVTGDPLEVLRGHSVGGVSAGVFDVAVAPDGVTIATAGEEGVAAVYRCALCRDVAGLLELADERVFRDFTPGERAQYRLEDDG